MYDNPVGLDVLLADRGRPELRNDLRLTIKTALDSDRRGFKAFASYLPLHAAFVGSDSSDDLFGQGLLLMLTPEQRRELRGLLQEILIPATDSGDALTRFASTLAELLGEGDTTPDDELRLLDAPTSRVSNLGDGLFTMLSRRLRSVASDGAGADRVRLLLRLSDFIASYVCLALLFEGAERDLYETDTDREKKRFEAGGVGEVLGLPVYCGPPPGPPHDMSVQFSSRCFADAVHRAHQGIQAAFVSVIESGHADLERLVLERLSGDDATRMLRAFRETNVLADPASAFCQLLTEKQLHQSVKLLGTKVGLVAPRRGSGSSRLVLETTFVDALAYFVGEDGMTFDAFVDRCYQQMGLLIGFPESISDRVLFRLEALAGQTIDAVPTLLRSAEHCRQRLINCGLAQEFSDHATVLRIQ